MCKINLLSLISIIMSFLTILTFIKALFFAAKKICFFNEKMVITTRPQQGGFSSVHVSRRFGRSWWPGATYRSAGAAGTSWSRRDSSVSAPSNAILLKRILMISQDRAERKLAIRLPSCRGQKYFDAQSSEICRLYSDPASFSGDQTVGPRRNASELLLATSVELLPSNL